jgi:hypothetical protein
VLLDDFHERTARNNLTSFPQSSGIGTRPAQRRSGTRGPRARIGVGRACQRVALTATARGLKHAFVNQPVEVAALREDLAALVGEPRRRPDLVMRLGFGPTLPYSPRRPVAEVLG